MSSAPPIVTRASAIRELYAQAAALAEVGDLAGARALHESVGRLLALESADGSATPVVDLASARRKGRES